MGFVSKWSQPAAKAFSRVPANARADSVITGMLCVSGASEPILLLAMVRMTDDCADNSIEEIAKLSAA
jgi:hypothetical protein